MEDTGASTGDTKDTGGMEDSRDMEDTGGMENSRDMKDIKYIAKQQKDTMTGDMEDTGDMH